MEVGQKSAASFVILVKIFQSRAGRLGQTIRKITPSHFAYSFPKTRAANRKLDDLLQLHINFKSLEIKHAQESYI